MIGDLVESLAADAHGPDCCAAQALPSDERVLWRGAPDRQALARAVFKTRWIAGAFGSLAVIRGAIAVTQGVSLQAGLSSVAWTLLPAALGLGLISLLAALQARSTEYVLTERRIVMQIGVAIPILINLPLSKIRSADLYASASGTRDIALTLEESGGLKYPILWPHAFLGGGEGGGCRHVLRCLADGEAFAPVLSRALHASLSHSERVDVEPHADCSGHTDAAHEEASDAHGAFEAMPAATA